MSSFLRSTIFNRINVKFSTDLANRFLCTSQGAIQVNQEFTDLMGQPSNKSHPHLVGSGEVVSGIQLSEVVKRRDKLVKQIASFKSSSSSHVIIIPSSTTFYMSEDVPYVFRQDSDFRYLTGCLEPDTALMLCISPDHSYKSTLFTREKNKHTELWEGPRTGCEKALEIFAVDDAYPLQEFRPVLISKLKQIGSSFTLWYDFQSSCQSSINECLSALIPDSGCEDVVNPEQVVHALRVIKSKAEQKIMADSCRIISECFIDSMKDTLKLKSEHQIFATLDYGARMKGAEILAYPPVVACGSNANIIHYIKNNQALSRSELILVDAGSELHGYCSDVTRTWPAGGKFSDHHRTLYDVVLLVQQELLAHLEKQRPSLDQLLQHMNSILFKRLNEAHVLTDLATSQNHKMVSHNFCPHHVGHYLGMDVHDTATIPRKIPVVEGMVVTVEPGVYIRHNNDYAKPEFRNCGIRVEDDVLITSNGINILSSHCPKTTKEIENLCKA